MQLETVPKKKKTCRVTIAGEARVAKFRIVAGALMS
jgi:hypothetical protein